MIKYYMVPEAIEEGIDPPAKAYKDDAGIDLRALYTYDLLPQTVAEVRTGVGFEIPDGFYGLICNRTSGAMKGILPVGHVVDAGFTGELVLILYNTNPAHTIHIEANERIAQMVVMPIHKGELRRINRSSIKKSRRGSKRLGSSGSFQFTLLE